MSDSGRPASYAGLMLLIRIKSASVARTLISAPAIRSLPTYKVKLVVGAAGAFIFGDQRPGAERTGPRHAALRIIVGLVFCRDDSIRRGPLFYPGFESC